MTEDQLTMSVIKLLKLKLHPAVIFYHVANEFKGTAKHGNKRKRMGVTKGVPDIIINWATYVDIVRFEHTVYIELKRPAAFKTSAKTGKKIIETVAGRLSLHQEEFKVKCDDMGLTYLTCYSINDVVNALDKFRVPLKQRRI